MGAGVCHPWLLPVASAFTSGQLPGSRSTAFALSVAVLGRL